MLRPVHRCAGVALAAVALLLPALTACGIYRNEPITCLDHDPASPADYAWAFAQRTTWSGGDGAATVPLPDGRLLWLFGDTFVDGLDAGGAPIGGFVRNSMVVQDRRCFALLTLGGVNDRRSSLPASIGEDWLWPVTGVVDPAGYVRVVALRMASAAGALGWQWRVDGLDVATLRLPSLQWVSTVAAPAPAGGRFVVGGSALTVGSDVYVYGTLNGRQAVARTTAATIGSVPWQFATPDDWSPDPADAWPLDMERPPHGQLSVMPHAGGFLASATTADLLADDVTTWFGPSPTGPFRLLGRAATTAPPRGWYSYGARIADLPGAGLVAVWSQNTDPSTGITDMRPYGPRFGVPAPSALPADEAPPATVPTSPPSSTTTTEPAPPTTELTTTTTESSTTSTEPPPTQPPTEP